MIKNKLVKAFIPPLFVLLVQAVILFTGLYVPFPQLDIPMHFIGGASIAFMFSVLLSLAEDKKLIADMHKALRFLFVFSFVSLVAIGWEFLEFVLDITINFQSQLSVADTMGDLLLGLLGAPVGYAIAKYKN